MKQERKNENSVLTVALAIVTCGVVISALVACFYQEETVASAYINDIVESENLVIVDKAEETVKGGLTVSSLITNAGKPTIQAAVKSVNTENVDEYRFYIKESSHDMYVLEEILEAPNYIYTGLKPLTEYDVKVVIRTNKGAEVELVKTIMTPNI